jgi:hypothetical protein
MSDPVTAFDLIAIASPDEATLIDGLVRRVLNARSWPYKADFREWDQLRTIAMNSVATAPQDPESGIGDTESPTEAQNEPQRPCVHCAAPLHRAPSGYWAGPNLSEQCWNASDFLHEPRPSRVPEPTEATPQAPVSEASTDESNPSEAKPERSEGAAGIKSFSEISREAAEWQRSQDLPDLTDEEAERLAVAKSRAIRSAMMNKLWKSPK